MDTYYLAIIHEFLLNPSDINFRGYADTSAKDIIKTLFKDKRLIDFYCIVSHLSIADNLDTFYEYFDIGDLPAIICILDKWFKDDCRDVFIKSSISSIKSAIENHCDYVDADDYSPDISDAINSATSFTEYGKDVDVYDAASYIEDEVSETVKDEIYDIIKTLPKDVVIESDYMKNLDVSVYSADNLVSSYLDDGDYEHECLESLSSDDDSEVDFMFDREFK